MFCRGKSDNHLCLHVKLVPVKNVIIDEFAITVFLRELLVIIYDQRFPKCRQTVDLIIRTVNISLDMPCIHDAHTIHTISQILKGVSMEQ